MKHILYIIPGFNEHTSQDEYQQIKTHFLNKKFVVVEISITWKRRVMSEYVEEFLSQCTHSNQDRVSILGYSLGAMMHLFHLNIFTIQIYCYAHSHHFLKKI
ncbi:MAG: hypothetical protein ACLFPL_04125 [Candidatus Nanoarchaeia archaeon]